MRECCANLGRLGGWRNQRVSKAARQRAIGVFFICCENFSLAGAMFPANQLRIELVCIERRRMKFYRRACPGATAPQLLHRVAWIIRDLQPTFVIAILTSVINSARIGEDHVAMRPVGSEAVEGR